MQNQRINRMSFYQCNTHKTGYIIYHEQNDYTPMEVIDFACKQACVDDTCGAYTLSILGEQRAVEQPVLEFRPSYCDKTINWKTCICFSYIDGVLLPVNPL